MRKGWWVIHRWGDEDVDWAGISDAAYWIGAHLRRWGRVNVTDTKEKYGTARVYCNFGWYQFFTITHPGYHFSRYPAWLWKLDCYYGHHLLRLVNWAVIPLQKILYRYLYKKAVKKWPHLAGEILLGADWSELLRGIDSRLVIRQTGPQSSTISWEDPDRPEPEDLP